MRTHRQELNNIVTRCVLMYVWTNMSGAIWLFPIYRFDSGGVRPRTF